MDEMDEKVHKISLNIIELAKGYGLKIGTRKDSGKLVLLKPGKYVIESPAPTAEPGVANVRVMVEEGESTDEPELVAMQMMAILCPRAEYAGTNVTK